MTCQLTGLTPPLAGFKRGTLLYSLFKEHLSPPGKRHWTDPGGEKWRSRRAPYLRPMLFSDCFQGQLNAKPF